MRPLTSRRLSTHEEWNLAARLKRDCDYALILSNPGLWPQPEIHGPYQEHWGEDQVEHQMERLREEALGGELRGWFRGRQLVAFATIRDAKPFGEDGPCVLVVRQLYILSGDNVARRVAEDLAAIAEEKGIVQTDLTLPAEHIGVFAEAGFEPTTVTARRR